MISECYGKDSWRRESSNRQKTLVSLKKKNAKKESGQPRVRWQERPSGETETREIICLPRMMLRQCCPGNAAARIMSWLVLLHLKAASQLSCLQPRVSRLPGTRSDELTPANGCTDFQYIPVSRVRPLHRQYFFSVNISIPGSLLDSRCVMWQGADLGPYLSLQLCSHSFLHQHLICHHCQSEQIRVSAADSERPPTSPCPWQAASLPVCHPHSHLHSSLTKNY